MEYINGNTIKELREKKHLTQLELANKLLVSDKTISKWETGHGLPDISIIDSLAKELGVSLIELFNDELVRNNNRSANLLKQMYYVCPICNNIIRTMGETIISCCGVTLNPNEEINDDKHIINVEIDNDEYVVSIDHPMEKNHYILFISYISSSIEQMCKLYPEGDTIARFKRVGHGFIYAYCLRDGLFKIKI